MPHIPMPRSLQALKVAPLKIFPSNAWSRLLGGKVLSGRRRAFGSEKCIQICLPGRHRLFFSGSPLFTMAQNS